MATASKATKVKVQVHFPLAPGGPYKATEKSETTVGEVRQAAMSHFGVNEDPGSRYYLADRNDEEIADEVALSTIDEEEPGKGTVKFTLVKELIQGVSVNLESELTLEADAKAVAVFLREHGGRLDGGEDSSGVYWLTLTPASDPSESYFARVAWSEYPGAPPSVKFAKSIGGALDDPRVWPAVPGFRAQSYDICMPFTAEGFALHPEWAGTSEAWRSTGNPFFYVASTLQRLLNTQYSGRFEP